MPAPPMYDYTKFDFDKPMFTIEDIRRVNPQRDEMEQLTAIVHVDREKNGVVGLQGCHASRNSGRRDTCPDIRSCRA